MDGQDLAAYLERPLEPVAPEVLDAIRASPINPSDAISREDLDRLLDPAPLSAETGWCRFDDGVAYVAVRTPMPAITGEMADWWFDWHPDESLRYRIWHPPGHESNRVERPATPGAKAHWGTIHHPVEDVGVGMAKLRIEFLPPSEIGFSTDALDDERVATIVCGHPGDEGTRMRHSLMVHVFLRDGEGVVLRSHFWMGALIRPYLPGPLATPISWALNNAFVRGRVMPSRLPAALANHCAEEYANLATLLPELYARYAEA